MFNPQNPNACALRVSRALNYSGITIPYMPGKTYEGADGKYYFLAVPYLESFLKKTFGEPDIKTLGNGTASDPLRFHSSLVFNKGIYIMRANNYEAFGATGHTTVYDFDDCIGGKNYFEATGGVKYVELWKLD